MVPTAVSPAAAIICRAAPRRADLRTLASSWLACRSARRVASRMDAAVLPPTGATRAATSARSASTEIPAAVMAAAAELAAGSKGVPAAGQQASSPHA